MQRVVRPWGFTCLHALTRTSLPSRVIFSFMLMVYCFKDNVDKYVPLEISERRIVVLFGSSHEIKDVNVLICFHCQLPCMLMLSRYFHLKKM